MGKIKNLMMDIQEKLGDDVEVTQEIFLEYLIQNQIIKSDEINNISDSEENKELS